MQSGVGTTRCTTNRELCESPREARFKRKVSTRTRMQSKWGVINVKDSARKIYQITSIGQQGKKNRESVAQRTREKNLRIKGFLVCTALAQGMRGRIENVMKTQRATPRAIVARARASTVASVPSLTSTRLRITTARTSTCSKASRIHLSQR